MVEVIGLEKKKVVGRTETDTKKCPGSIESQENLLSAELFLGQIICKYFNNLGQKI